MSREDTNKLEYALVLRNALIEAKSIVREYYLDQTEELWKQVHIEVTKAEPIGNLDVLRFNGLIVEIKSVYVHSMPTMPAVETPDLSNYVHYVNAIREAPLQNNTPPESRKFRNMTSCTSSTPLTRSA